MQDLPELVEQGTKEIWPREAPKALAEGRVTLMPHDFFKPNPVKEADIYWLRGVMYALLSDSPLNTTDNGLQTRLVRRLLRLYP